MAAQDSLQLSFTGLVGAADTWHLNNLLDNRTHTDLIPGLSIGQAIDADYSAPFAQPIPTNFTGYKGAAAQFLRNGAPDGRINVGSNSPTCNGAPGCVGDMNSILTNGLGNSGLNYMSVAYAGIWEHLLDSGAVEIYQLFNVSGQGALVNGGVTIAHLTLHNDFTLRYLSGVIPAPTTGGNGGGESTAIPEPVQCFCCLEDLQGRLNDDERSKPSPDLTRCRGVERSFYYNAGCLNH